MSVTSKVTLAVSMSLSTGIISYVHYKQTLDKEKLHEGVVRDVERRERRKLENEIDLKKQTNLDKQLNDEDCDQINQTKN